MWAKISTSQGRSNAKISSFAQLNSRHPSLPQPPNEKENIFFHQ